MLLNTESNGKEQADQNIEASAQEQCIEEQIHKSKGRYKGVKK